MGSCDQFYRQKFHTAFVCNFPSDNIWSNLGTAQLLQQQIKESLIFEHGKTFIFCPPPPSAPKIVFERETYVAC